MKLILRLTAGIAVILFGTAGFAEPWEFRCAGALEKLSKTRKAVVEHYQEVQRANAKKKVAFAEIMVCEAGGIVTYQRLHRCFNKRLESPLHVRDLVEAEEELRVATEAFNEHLLTVHRACTKD